MLARIEVALKPALKDALGEKTARRMREDLGLRVEACRTIRVYLVEANLTEDELVAFATGPLCDPVTEIYAVEKPLAPVFGFDWLIQVGFRPGVTDNEGRVAREALALLLGRRLDEEENVYFLRQYLVQGELSRQEAE
ncbi:MAG TPA: phosphoribosylformylglycinamidine synthase, partial [Thermodesulfatator atlanticus]|nr:phosphoribosylformylglycinamidine synthase [Thermodesulfatator atlanticus]